MNSESFASRTERSLDDRDDTFNQSVDGLSNEDLMPSLLIESSTFDLHPFLEFSLLYF